MRLRFAAAVAAALLAGPVCAADDPFAKAAAEMKKELGTGFILERSGVFIIAGDCTRARYQRYKRHTVEACAEALWKGFFDKKPDYPIKVYLFAGKKSYEK